MPRKYSRKDVGEDGGRGTGQSWGVTDGGKNGGVLGASAQHLADLQREHPGGYQDDPRALKERLGPLVIPVVLPLIVLGIGIGALNWDVFSERKIL